ncbi:MAG: hypothetical protein KC415_10150 [Anaerolineales bacterium]|nr:hypothetical protein [Anaerolineales bacterium]
MIAPEALIKSRLLIFLLIVLLIVSGGMLLLTVYSTYDGWHSEGKTAVLPTLMPTLAISLPIQVVLPLVVVEEVEAVAASSTAVPTQPIALALPPTPTETPRPTETPLPTVTPTPTPTLPPNVTPTVTPYPTPELILIPGEPQGYLDKFRLVAFYGSVTGPGLGILGNQSREETLNLLRQRVAQYQPFSPERPILPTYHIIISVANTTPPYYYANINLELIEEWVEAAKESGTAVILDIQPGQGDVMFIYNRVRHLLYNPHVHFAIDPEFNMASGEVPGQKVGSLYASDINAVQADLNQIGLEIGLNRVLILHQFSVMMLPDKEAIEDYPYVELVIDGDGVGSSAAKIRNYNEYAQQSAFEYGGFKLFPTDGDYPVLTPQEVMSLLKPQPVIIIYQ